MTDYLEPIRKKLTKLGDDTSAARVEQLISIMYLYKSVDWDHLGTYMGYCIVREIERGNRSWRDSFIDFVRMIYHAKSTKSNERSKFSSMCDNKLKGAINLTFCKTISTNKSTNFFR